MSTVDVGLSLSRSTWARINSFDLTGDAENHYRILIWGNSGAGKTTLSKQLATILGPSMKRIDMDSLLWNDNWVKTEPVALVEKLHAELAAESWVTDGNYVKRSQEAWAKCTDIIWLDYPLYVNFYRILKRTFWRWWTREKLFGTNCQEKLSETLFSRDSILWWCISQQWNVRRQLEVVVREHGLSVRRFYSPSETDAWFARIKEAVAGVD